jgi:hypothetical protein
MASQLRTLQWILVGTAAIFGSCIAGVVGLGVGADYGGVFCHDCEFNGVRGYEATGLIGFLIGAGVGFVLAAWGVRALLLRHNAKLARAGQGLQLRASEPAARGRSGQSEPR